MEFLNGGSFWRRYELPTWGIAISVYTGWLALTWCYRFLPTWLVLPLGAWLLAWHGSLQHEAVHGHPTRSARVNGLVAGAPLALWMPFALYRETHLAHHRVEQLTDPSKDPESFYTSGDAWRRMGALGRAAHWVLA